jgi:hypothetical protein
MKKLTVTIVLGLVSAGVLATAGLAIGDSSDTGARHKLTFNRAQNEANKLALRECQIDPNCFAYGAPTCSSNHPHKWTCTIHNILGVPGDQAQQADCHRDAQFLIKRAFGKRLFFKWVSNWVCVPNAEHPGLKGLSAR